MTKGTIIITGASSGIGKATAKMLSDKGYDILDISRTSGYDLSELNTVNNIKANNVAGIVNNAAICLKKEFYNYTETEFLDTFMVNLYSMWKLCKKFYPNLIQTEGSIVNVSSVHAIATIPRNSVYAMTKGGIEAFTRGMALELAPYDVRVNCVRPGSTMTPMLGYVEGMENTIPLKKVATPEEVANVICYLLSEESSFITGECISVDGGTLARLSVLK